MSASRDEHEDLINDALDGRLEPAARQRFDALRARDPEFAHEWEQRQALRDTLRALGTEAAPPDLARRIAFLVREHPEQDPAPEATPAHDAGEEAVPPSRFSWLTDPWRRAGPWRSIAALLLLGVVGWTLWQERRGRPEDAVAGRRNAAEERTGAAGDAHLAPLVEGRGRRPRPGAAPASETGAAGTELAEAGSQERVRLFLVDPDRRRLALNLTRQIQEAAYLRAVVVAEHLDLPGGKDGANKSATVRGRTLTAGLASGQVMGLPADFAATLFYNQPVLPEEAGQRVNVLMTALPEVRVPPVTASEGPFRFDVDWQRRLEEAKRAPTERPDRETPSEDDPGFADGRAKKIDRLAANEDEGLRAAEKTAGPPKAAPGAGLTKRKEDRSSEKAAPDRSAAPRRPEERRKGEAREPHAAETRVRDAFDARKGVAASRLVPVLPAATTDYLLTGPGAVERVDRILAEIEDAKVPRLATVARSRLPEASGGQPAAMAGKSRDAEPPPVRWRLWQATLEEGQIRRIISRLESEPELRVRTLSPPETRSREPGPAPFAVPFDPDADAADTLPRQRRIRLLALGD